MHEHMLHVFSEAWTQQIDFSYTGRYEIVPYVGM